MMMMRFKAIVILISLGSAICPMLGHGAAERPLEMAKTIQNVQFSKYFQLYIDTVTHNAVSFGKAGLRSATSGTNTKSLQDAKATLPEAAVRLREMLKKDLRELSFSATILDEAPRVSDAKKTLTLEMEITDFDPGSRLKRAFLGLFGGGKVRVGVKGQFLEHLSIDPLVQFYHERYAAWTIAGELPNRLLLNAVDDIARDIAIYITGKWTE